MSLTWEQLKELLDSVPELPPPYPLVLPGWFPHDQREYAERWATDHGWAGVVYARTQPRKGSDG